MKITVSAPGKLMLFGEHAVVYGHSCIVTAISRRIYVIVKKQVKYTSDVYFDTAGLDTRFVTAVISVFEKHFNSKVKGIVIATKSDFGEISGLGSSAAVTVACIYALCEFFGNTISKKALFDLSYKAVLKVQDVGSGFDIAASIYGGTLYYRNEKTISLRHDRFNARFIVGFTGEKAGSASIVKELARKRKKDANIDKIFVEIADIVERAKKALFSDNWREIGLLMNKNHKLLKDLSVSSDSLDKLTKAALNAGALGAKLSGAGRGDCMIALVSEGKRKSVEKAIKAVGGRVIPLEFGEEGARIENSKF